MSNLARQLFYNEETPFAIQTPARKIQPVTKAKSKARTLSNEDREIVTAMNTVRRELEYLHNRYDNTADDLLVESLIYEIKAANMKYQYYLNLCKNRGIVYGIGG